MRAGAAFYSISRMRAWQRGTSGSTRGLYQRLPVERIGEIHVTGLQALEGACSS